MNIDHIKEFAKANISSISRPSKYHFRDRYEHSLRVLKWAERIQKIEGGDIEAIRIASVLHDIGWKDNINHAVVSKQLAEAYLREVKYDNSKLPIVLEAIENHNNRETKNQLNIESLILMDADILDEVGAISILWDAMASVYETNANYHKVYNRIKRCTEEIKQRKQLVRTETGIKYYGERLQIIDNFLKELKYELGI